MKTTRSLIVVACIALLSGCGATVPGELSSARQAYLQASEGPAAELTPAELHTAKEALALAEESFKKDSDSYRTRDLAYVAQRRAEMAEAQAAIAIERRSTAAANRDFQTTQGSILREKTQDLREAQKALAASEQGGQAIADQLAASERAGQVTADQLAAEQRAGQVTADQLAAEQRAHLETGKKMDEWGQQMERQPAAVVVVTPPPPAQTPPPPAQTPPPPAQTPPPAAVEPVAQATMEQLVAVEVARLEAERKSAEQNRQIEKDAQDLNQTRTALAVSEYASKSAADQLASEQRARLDADNLRAEQDRRLAEKVKELDRAQAALAATERSAEQDRQMRQNAQELREARSALAASEQASREMGEQLAVEKKARQAAEKTTAEVQAGLAKLMAKNDERGEVFTFSGGVLFRTNEATLMPGAELQLDRLVAALAANPGRLVVVEGHTDSQGSAAYNLALSMRRADAVRDYLVRKGHPADMVRANGIGQDSPIADNATSEGRANNRRVEVVLGSMTTP